MDTQEINDRLVAVGAVLKAKGWESASIDLSVSYLAMFDREPTPRDSMISYQPSIRATTRGPHNVPITEQFVIGAWGVTTLEVAVSRLDEVASSMPFAKDFVESLSAARSKLSDAERRLLGVR